MGIPWPLLGPELAAESWFRRGSSVRHVGVPRSRLVRSKTESKNVPFFSQRPMSICLGTGFFVPCHVRSRFPLPGIMGASSPLDGVSLQVRPKETVLGSLWSFDHRRTHRRRKNAGKDHKESEERKRGRPGYPASPPAGQHARAAVRDPASTHTHPQGTLTGPRPAWREAGVPLND